MKRVGHPHACRSGGARARGGARGIYPRYRGFSVDYVRERNNGIGEEHHPESTDRDIEVPSFEAMILAIGLLECDIAQPLNLR